MAFSADVGGQTRYQQSGIEWIPSDYVKQPDVLTFYSVVLGESGFASSSSTKTVAIKLNKTDKPSRELNMVCTLGAMIKDPITVGTTCTVTGESSAAITEVFTT